MKFIKKLYFLNIIAATLSTSSLFSMSIFEAINQNNLKLVEDIASQPGFKVDATLTEGRDKGLTPLYTACLYNKPEIVRLLLKKDANPNSRVAEGPCQGLTPLYIACVKGNTNVAQILIQKLKSINQNCDINSPLASGPFQSGTPLHIACQNNCPEVVQVLIENGANPNLPLAEGPGQGFTPLYVACLNNCPEVVRVLIKNGTDPNLPLAEGPDQGLTPLYVACLNNCPEVVRVLIKNGTDPNLPLAEGPDQGFTPLYAACLNNFPEVVKVLIENGVNPNAPLAEGPNKGITPLYVACLNNCPEVVKVLIENGVNPNAPLAEGPNKGFTPLIIVCLNGHLEVAKYLIQQLISTGNNNFNAPFTSGPFTGKTPLDIAIEERNFEIVQFFILNGATNNNLSYITKDFDSTTDKVNFVLSKKLDPINNDCSICLEDIADQNISSTLGCKHKFHENCINNWIREIKMNIQQTCPYCRQPMEPLTLDYFKFLTKLTFTLSVRELDQNESKNITETDFYALYNRLQDNDLENIFQIKRKESINEFIIEAAAKNNFQIGENLLKKLRNQDSSYPAQSNETKSSEMSDDNQLQNNKKRSDNVGKKRKIESAKETERLTEYNDSTENKEIEAKRKKLQ